MRRGCGEIPRLDFVNKINGKYFKLRCGRVYRLHVDSMKWIRNTQNDYNSL